MDIFLKNEILYKLIANIAIDGIFITNERGLLKFVSDNGANMLGYSVGELVGENFSIFVPKKGASVGKNIFERLMTGETVQHTLILMHKNGEDIPVYFHITPVIEENVFKGTIGMVRDLSDNKNMDMERIRLTSQLEDVKIRYEEYRKQIEKDFKEKYPNIDLPELS